LFVVLSGKKQPKHVGKMPEIGKKFDSEVITTFSRKKSAKCTNFEVSVSNFKSRVSVSVSEFLIKPRSRHEILTRSRSQRLRSRLHHWCIFRLRSRHHQLLFK